MDIQLVIHYVDDHTIQYEIFDVSSGDMRSLYKNFVALADDSDDAKIAAYTHITGVYEGYKEVKN